MRVYIPPTEVSIHAPTRGATKMPYGEPKYYTGFQSTLPRGERQSSSVSVIAITAVSIHAPTRGATEGAQDYTAHYLRFNPRSHEGSDQTWSYRQMLLMSFNPRSHEGSDAARSAIAPFIMVFQSTLPRGERLPAAPLLS